VDPDFGVVSRISAGGNPLPREKVRSAGVHALQAFVENAVHLLPQRHQVAARIPNLVIGMKDSGKPLWLMVTRSDCAPLARGTEYTSTLTKMHGMARSAPCPWHPILMAAAANYLFSSNSASMTSSPPLPPLAAPFAPPRPRRRRPRSGPPADTSSRRACGSCG